MAVKFLDLRKQYEEIKPDIDLAIAGVIRDALFVSGPYATKFEENFASFQNARYCVGCANGTDAIEISLEALDLPPGSEVIVPANTFIASAEAVTRSGHRVVFCDCDRDDYTISIESLASKVTPKTSAVIVVHLYGQPCKMGPIVDLAQKYNLRIVEDCAQAHGSTYESRSVGTIGDIGTFSFYPGKNLGAFGDAGAITTNSESLSRRVRMIANHGRTAKYDHEFEGRNSRLDGIQAAILSAKLAHLSEWIARREAVARRYLTGLEDVGDIVLPATRDWGRHVYHLFVVRTAHRDGLQNHLKSNGIETGIHYPIALPKLSAYAYCDQASEPFFANQTYGQLLSLPIGDHMNRDDADEVILACKAYFQKC